MSDGLNQKRQNTVLSILAHLKKAGQYEAVPEFIGPASHMRNDPNEWSVPVKLKECAGNALWDARLFVTFSEGDILILSTHVSVPGASPALMSIYPYPGRHPYSGVFSHIDVRPGQGLASHGPFSEPHMDEPDGGEDVDEDDDEPFVGENEPPESLAKKMRFMALRMLDMAQALSGEKPYLVVLQRADAGAEGEPFPLSQCHVVWCKATPTMEDVLKVIKPDDGVHLVSFHQVPVDFFF